jgi:hypothetical protein
MMTRLPLFWSLTLMSKSACHGSRSNSSAITRLHRVPVKVPSVVGFVVGFGFEAGVGSRASGVRFSSSPSPSHRSKSKITKDKNDATLSALKLPTKWQHTVKQNPKEHLLLVYSGQQKLQAFFGDKLLYSAAAGAIQNAYADQTQQH